VVEEASVGDSKKNAEKEGRTIVFVDESGLSERPYRVRTWAPKGETPVLQYHFHWNNLSAIAGITLWNFYFRLFPGAIGSREVVIFLSHLLRHIRRRLLVIWDSPNIHKGRLIWEFLAGKHPLIKVEFLPGYAPELNPVEYIWGHLKKHEIPNLCPKDFAELGYHARSALRRMRRRPTLVTAFWKQSGLFD
jgi:transposase